MATRFEEQVLRAIALAHRAEGFSGYLHEQGLIGRGNEVREAVESLLALGITPYPDFVVSARIEVADALARLLDAHGYDWGKRKSSDAG